MMSFKSLMKLNTHFQSEWKIFSRRLVIHSLQYNISWFNSNLQQSLEDIHFWRKKGQFWKIVSSPLLMTYLDSKYSEISCNDVLLKQVFFPLSHSIFSVSGFLSHIFLQTFLLIRWTNAMIGIRKARFSMREGYRVENHFFIQNRF